MTNNALYSYIGALLVFFAVAFLVMGIVNIIYSYNRETRIKRLLNDSIKKTENTRKHAIQAIKSSEKFRDVVLKLNQLAKPNEDWKESQTKLKFVRAGIRADNAPSMLYGVKTILFFLLPILYLIPALLIFNIGFTNGNLTLILLLGALGYYLPDIYLSKLIAKRKMEMQDALPDFVDLLVMCSSAGMGLDYALSRVSIEMSKTSPVLSEEIYLACLEIRAGSGRIPALKNLALRVNLDDLNNLVTMLVQADKFGTSLVDSMKTQSEYMRIQRLQRAEEFAAKVPVKMLLPMVIFLFPVLLMVLIGPAFVQIAAAFFK